MLAPIFPKSTELTLQSLACSWGFAFGHASGRSSGVG